MREQRRVPKYRLGERPTLCNSHGSDVLARRLILEFRTRPAAEAPFSNFSQRKGMGMDPTTTMFFCTSAMVQRSTFRIRSQLTALVLPLLTRIDINQLAMNFGYLV
jgi:hypothetical protein